MECPNCRELCEPDVLQCPNCKHVFPINDNKHSSNGRSLVGCFEIDKRLREEAFEEKNFESIGALFDALCSHLSGIGFSFKRGELRLLLAAMASGRIMYLPCERKDEPCSLLSSINRFFVGMDVSVDDSPESPSSISSLFGSIHSLSEKITFRETCLFKNIYMASALQAPLIHIVKKCTDERDILPSFIRRYADAPYAEIPTVRIPELSELPRFFRGDELPMPRNMWFAVLDSGGARVGLYPEIKLSLTPSEVNDAPTKGKLPYDGLLTLVSKSRAEKYFSEAIWQRLDRFGKFLSERIPAFKLDNPTLRALESFSSVCLSLGATEVEALDDMLSVYFLPFIAHRLGASGEWKKALGNIFDRLNLPTLEAELNRQE